MTSKTQERLRDAATAYGEQIQASDVRELRFPDAAWEPSGRRRPRWWRLPSARSVVPLAAAAAVLALVVSLTLAGHALRPPGPHSSPTSPAVSVSPFRPAKDLPKFLVTVVQGRGSILSSATGEVVAAIARPTRFCAFVGVAVAPGDRTFYLACQLVSAGNRNVHLEFYKYALSATGQPGRGVQIPGPVVALPLPVSSDALKVIPLAISPDGKYLAWAVDDQLYPTGVAPEPPSVTVRNVLTGATRTWRTWLSTMSVISGVSWGADGQLGVAASLGRSYVRDGKIILRGGFSVSAFLVLDTRSPGSNLLTDSKLALYEQDVNAPTSVYNPPVLTGGLLGPNGADAYVLLRAGGVTKLMRIPIADVRASRVLLRGNQAAQSIPAGIDGRFLLVPVSPGRKVRPSGYYTCAHLAGISLPSGHLRQLPVPIHCDTEAPLPPLQAGW